MNIKKRIYSLKKKMYNGVFNIFERKKLLYVKNGI